MLIYLILIVALVAFDQITKYLAIYTLVSEGNTIPIIQDFFHFTYVRNPGVVFGLGGDQGFPLIFFIVTSFIALGIFGYFLYKTDYKNKKLWMYHLGLALMIAGTLGNFIDRLFQIDHRVIDFIDFRGIWGYIFNIADMCLVVGMIVFIFDQFILEPKRSTPHETGTGSAV
jgi:signal peptidase II